jgi:hypothetical protein
MARPSHPPRLDYSNYTWRICVKACKFNTSVLMKNSYLNYWGEHPVARVSSNVNKPPYATMFFGARFYCALTLHSYHD